MTKREFLEQYILARASIMEKFSSEGVVYTGVKVYDLINSECDGPDMDALTPKPPLTRPNPKG